MIQLRNTDASVKIIYKPFIKKLFNIREKLLQLFSNSVTMSPLLLDKNFNGVRVSPSPSAGGAQSLMKQQKSWAG
jgi:hypothetical protein